MRKILEKLRTFWQALWQAWKGDLVEDVGNKPEEPEEKRPYGYELLIKNVSDGRVLFRGLVFDYGRRQANCLLIALEDGDKLGKLRILLTGSELVFARELNSRGEFFGKALAPSKPDFPSADFFFWY